MAVWYGTGARLSRAHRPDGEEQDTCVHSSWQRERLEGKVAPDRRCTKSVAAQGKPERGSCKGAMILIGCKHNGRMQMVYTGRIERCIGRRWAGPNSWPNIQSGLIRPRVDSSGALSDWRCCCRAAMAGQSWGQKCKLVCVAVGSPSCLGAALAEELLLRLEQHLGGMAGQQLPPQVDGPYFGVRQQRALR
jgi:hypothetical protein